MFHLYTGVQQSHVICTKSLQYHPNSQFSNFVPLGKYAVSQFMFKDPFQSVVDEKDVEVEINAKSNLIYDTDGDIIVKRRSRSAFIRKEAITLCKFFLGRA